LKLPKEACLFPVMNLDNMTPFIQKYFKNFFTSPGYYLLTQDLIYFIFTFFVLFLFAFLLSEIKIYGKI